MDAGTALAGTARLIENRSTCTNDRDFRIAYRSGVFPVNTMGKGAALRKVRPMEGAKPSVITRVGTPGKPAENIRSNLLGGRFIQAR